MEQRQDEGGALAQDVVSFAAVGAEVAVVGAVATPHGLHHGGAQLHGGREGLGITACKGQELFMQEHMSRNAEEHAELRQQGVLCKI